MPLVKQRPFHTLPGTQEPDQQALLSSVQRRWMKAAGELQNQFQTLRRFLLT